MTPWRSRRARLVVALSSLAIVTLVGAAGCSSGPPVPDWQLGARAASERAVQAYLTGNARVAGAELMRARGEVARTGRIDLLARVELAQCAAQVASLVVGPCVAFEPLRIDAPAAERAYADYLRGASLPAADAALLPEPHRAVLASAASLAAVPDPLARIVAAGVLFETGRAAPQTIAVAVDTASAQGWRRPLLAWLGVQLRRAEAAGAQDEAQRLRRRIAVVEHPAPSMSGDTTR